MLPKNLEENLPSVEQIEHELGSVEGIRVVAWSIVTLEGISL